VIVNWNAGRALETCLESLLRDVDARPEIVLVDNGSSDGSTAAARRRHPGLRLVETGENLGFAAGANRGAAVASGEVLVFLNPDAAVLPGAVDTLVAALAGTPAAGVAGGGLVDAGGRWEPGSARFGVLGHLLLDTTVGRLPDRLRREPYVVDWVYGTFMAVRRDLFRQLGGFDERYFVYGEDLDFCYRASRVGARTIHVPGARAAHAGNVSARARFGPRREAEVVRGEMRFLALRRSPSTLHMFRVLAGCKFGLKAVLAAALGRRAATCSHAAVVRAVLAFQGGVHRRPERTA
jgi:hypothetical protein